jgi:putative FmdB family regulatory protein
MPIYEYSCDACGHEFEASQRISEPPIRTCVRCTREAATRRVSRPSFILKGGGWYADGYSRPGPNARSSGSETTTTKGSA